MTTPDKEKREQARLQKARLARPKREKRMADRADAAGKREPRKMSDREREYQRVRQRVVKVLE